MTAVETRVEVNFAASAAVRPSYVRDVMSQSILCGLLAVLVLAGCATRPPRAQSVYRQDVTRQLLPPAPQSGASTSSYALQPGERFRMPEALSDTAPSVPAEAAIRELPPTRVCVRVAIAADGSVKFADSLTEREECAAGADPSNAPLVEAMLAAVRNWHFRPAAMCRFAAGTPMPGGDSCEGAQQIQVVPVTLQFAFTFSVHEGRVQVQSERP